MKKTYIVLLLSIDILLFISCSENNDIERLATVVTTSISSINSTTAYSGGSVMSNGGLNVTARGVCWSIIPSPSIFDNHTSDGCSSGVFISLITELLPNTTYFVRAYATNSIGTAYGSELSFTTTGSDSIIIDIDGNVYHTITIGTKTWMVQNLIATRYQNGDSITNVTDNTVWSNLTKGAYCNYINNTIYSSTFGRLYNWYTINDIRKIAPAGWHVATSHEWQTLINSFGGEYLAGGILKESDTVHWKSPNTGADNSSGFTAIPGGYRNDFGTFNFMGINGRWWSATEYNSTMAYYYTMYYNSPNASNGNTSKKEGLSIRCVKD